MAVMTYSWTSMHYFIGDFGHLMVISAFVLALLSAIAYWNAARSADMAAAERWRRFARGAFGLHGLSVLGIIGALFWIIYHHYYEYHYAWSHSSNNLPTHYMISCFWEGQEGSFLLWAFWHVLLGGILLRTAKSWEVRVMWVFAAVQAFLLSMILGVVIGDMKIGSSPFILTRDVLDAPIFKTNPEYIPADGTGLNPLLQNYWMVIHPPTLFLGFAGTLIPFAFCIAGLWEGKYKEWVKPALPWGLATAAVLGIGIMMGAYWAYETLNFGGYWNWDPVENAVYVPWLILVAALHLMVLFRRNGSGLRLAVVLTMLAFVLVLYATFLTRSGVLGNASVHSFTDLGLSGQLLVYLIFFALVAVGLTVWRWKALPAGSEREAGFYQVETWVFTGAAILGMSAFQVLLPTSIPAINSLLNGIGIASNMAPPADQVQFYTKWQLWFGVGIALVSGTAQFFWWQRMDAAKLNRALTVPLVLTFLLSAALIAWVRVSDWKYIILLTVSVYTLLSNATTMYGLRRQLSMTGGTMTHIGIALMLLGILFSAGYSQTISLNNTGLVYNREFSDEMNRENLLLFRGEPRQMFTAEYYAKDQRGLTQTDLDALRAKYGYTLTYRGVRTESRDFPTFIDKEKLLPAGDPYRAIVREDLVHEGKTYAQRGDTIQVYAENTYYQIEYAKADGTIFTLYPRVQINEQMGGPVPSPDIKRAALRDIYTHITNIPDPEAETKWSEAEEHILSRGDTFFINDYVAILDGISREMVVPGVQLGPEDFAVKANIRVMTKESTYDIHPLYLIKDQQAGILPQHLPELGVKISFEAINPKEEKFTFQVSTTQKDWVIMKAVEFPYINLLWAGTLLMGLGMVVAAKRRFSELVKA